MDPCVKGQSCNIAKQYIGKIFGPQALEKVFAQMNEESCAVFSKNILSSSWQSEKAFIDFLFSAEKVFGRSDDELSFDIGYFSANNSISKFYKIFIRFGNPEFIVERATRLWSQIHNNGDFTVQSPKPKTGIVTLKNFSFPSVFFCSYLRGYITGVLEMSGGVDVSVKETQCVCNGAAVCEFLTKRK